MAPNNTSDVANLPKSAGLSNPSKYICPICGVYKCLAYFPSGFVQPASSPVKQPVTSPAKPPVSRRKLPRRICRSSRVSLKVASHMLKSADIVATTHDSTRPTRTGERIVDFLRFSHDVTIFRVGLPFGGTLKIKDRHFKTLRVATSSTGDFLLGQPLEVEAGKFYRMYLISRATATMDRFRGSSWKTKFGDVTAEWGNFTTSAGMNLWVCR